MYTLHCWMEIIISYSHKALYIKYRLFLLHSGSLLHSWLKILCMLLFRSSYSDMFTSNLNFDPIIKLKQNWLLYKYDHGYDYSRCTHLMILIWWLKYNNRHKNVYLIMVLHWDMKTINTLFGYRELLSLMEKVQKHVTRLHKV